MSGQRTYATRDEVASIWSALAKARRARRDHVGAKQATANGVTVRFAGRFT